MALPLTLSLTALFAAVAILCGWLGARSPDPLRGPRLVPYRLLMLITAAVALVLATHVVNLLGISTGPMAR